MKKQFFRVKQLADQTFQRAEKSQHLSNELQKADQKVEYLRVALAAVAKRLPQNNSNAPDKEAYDKRMRKLLEYQLGTVMKEYGSKKEEGFDHDESLLRPVLVKCGKTQVDLAKEMTEHEIKVEQMVSSPIQQVLDNDIPAILKTKRNLSKLVLDKDSANNRYHTANKHGTKTESLKDEMEEAEQKVEHCRDSLAAEMFSLLRRESDLAQYMLQLVKLQRAYHESALHTLEDLIPELEKEIGDSPVKAVYGCPLEEHLRLSKRQIALPLELCVCALWELGMTEEGLFRVAGGTSRVRRMKLSLDSGCFQPNQQLIVEYRDVHVIASALKSYLRELPEPLLTYHLYEDWIRAAKMPTEEQRIDSITKVLQKLPQVNYENLRYLMKFLGELSKNPKNKMTSTNIAIVMAPNLLWSVQEINSGINMSSAQIVNSIVDSLVTNVDIFFPGDIQIYQTFNRDILFSDLTEFERPNIQHMRSSSNDTILIQIDPEINHLSEKSSPPHGSPKPVSRKKNKPAPIPPLAIKTEEKPPKPAYPSGSSTINRTTYRNAKSIHENEVNGKNNKVSVCVGTSERRKSLDFDKNMTNHVKNINKSDISSPISTETTNIDMKVEPLQQLSPKIQQITTPNAFVDKINMQKKFVTVMPVAAPRTSLLEKNSSNMSKSLNEIDLGDGELVQLRKSSKDDFLNRKPAIPERPATLRPSSFRISRQGISSGSESDASASGSGTTLERTHLYSVEKQQVSFVQYRPGHDTQIAEKEKFLLSNYAENKKDLNSNERLEETGNGNSEGEVESPKSPTGPNRPPRPQPPPPPPPTVRPKSDGESTDL